MDKKTKQALEGSIAKWEAIVAGTGEDQGVCNCPLCRLFFGKDCVGCPVMERTGRWCCRGSPYDAWSTLHDEEMPDEKRVAEAAKTELEFLKSLREE